MMIRCLLALRLVHHSFSEGVSPQGEEGTPDLLLVLLIDRIFNEDLFMVLNFSIQPAAKGSDSGF